MTYSTQIHLVCVCLLKMHNSHITSWLDIINFLWLCVAEVNPHAKRFWWQGYLFPLKALNLNKINVQTRNWDPTLIAEDGSRTKTLQKTYLDRFHRYGILERRGIGCNNATYAWLGDYLQDEIIQMWDLCWFPQPGSHDLQCQGLISASSEFSFAQQFWQSTISHPFRRILGDKFRPSVMPDDKFGIKFSMPNTNLIT